MSLFFIIVKTMVNSKSILLIEDDHDIRVCLRQTLESTGFNISSAANGRDALNLLQRNPLPRLIIVDLCMPIMSGEEFLQKRLHDPELKEIPVLVRSSHLTVFSLR